MLFKAIPTIKTDKVKKKVRHGQHADAHNMPNKNRELNTNTHIGKMENVSRENLFSYFFM